LLTAALSVLMTADDVPFGTNSACQPVRWKFGCEIASKRDPTREAVHLVDHTKEFKTLVGSRFARDVTSQ
jgi:hypothetical protein